YSDMTCCFGDKTEDKLLGREVKINKQTDVNCKVGKISEKVKRNANFGELSRIKGKSKYGEFKPLLFGDYFGSNMVLMTCFDKVACVSGEATQTELLIDGTGSKWLGRLEC